MAGNEVAAARRHLALLWRYVLRTVTRPDVMRVNGTRFRVPASASPFMRALSYREEFGRSAVARMQSVYVQ